MIFTKTKLEGAYIIDLQKIEDERGFFARSFCVNEFIENQLSAKFVQHNISYNKKKGTIRGMHFQEAPHQETKVVRCICGEIYDVIVDLRKKSKTYMQWEGFTLSSNNRKMLYVPKGFAHGYQTLKNNSEVLYLVDEFYVPSAENGIKYNDNKLNIKWPIKENIIISSKDAKAIDWEW